MTQHINIVDIVILFLHLDFATNDDITRPDSKISSFFFFFFVLAHGQKDNEGC